MEQRQSYFHVNFNNQAKLQPISTDTFQVAVISSSQLVDSTLACHLPASPGHPATAHPKGDCCPLNAPQYLPDSRRYLKGQEGEEEAEGQECSDGEVPVISEAF